MKLKWVWVIILVLVFSGGRMALADGEHKKATSGNSHSENMMEGMDMSSNHVEKESHGSNEKEMSVSPSSNDSKDMEGMEMEEGGHGHEPVQEKPANVKVLGTYGAVNLSFIVFGVWNRWFRRKEDTNGDPK